jgi:hypothetical protein
MLLLRTLRLSSAFALLVTGLGAQEGLTFQKPPKPILDLVDAENLPATLVDLDARLLLLLERPAFLDLEDLAQPELRLAGLRINPRTYNASRTRPSCSW